MANEYQEYPEIEFIETDTDTIVSNMIALYEEICKESGRKDYQVHPASPERIFISWLAAVIVQQRILINETAKLNVPRYAAQSENEEYLDSLAELFRGTKRLPASCASATFRFYISQPQTEATIIPVGTRISFDGNIIFQTTESLVISSGETYGDVEGVCATSGTVGNGLAVGQVKQVIDVYDHYLKAENITVTAGGAEKESNASYYERLRQSLDSFSTAGSVESYIYHTKSVSSAISDVVATSDTPGIVDIRILLENGEVATETILQEVQEALSADEIRPLTDLVRVSNPDTVDFDVDVSFYIKTPDANSANIINTAVRNAVTDYLKWQTTKIGRDINPSYLIQLMMQAGAKRVEVRQPTFTIISNTSVSKIGNIVVVNGGIEDV